MDVPARRGLLAMSFAGEPAADLETAAASVAPGPVHVVASGDIRVGAWGLPTPAPDDDTALLLSATARRHESEQSPAQIRGLLLGSGRSGLNELLPTFAAAAWRGRHELVAAADRLGFRQLYYMNSATWAGLCTSAGPLARAKGAELDREALAVQSLLGWQLGQRTPFRGVTKLPAGCAVNLTAGTARLDRFTTEPDTEPLPLDAAVAEAAAVLRGYVEALLDDHPDAVLQLTGGLDSRVLLSAIPLARRSGLRTMTLGVPGVPDLQIAAELSARYGMRHEVLSLDGLAELDPDEAYALCVDAATRLDGTADPLAYASLAFAEARSESGPRISGLGGEVARGFYYFGWRTGAPVTPQRSARLANWRMFANDAVSIEALDPQFAAWAREFATAEVQRVLAATGKPWLAATDELYLAHRMQRWGGITETTMCLERPVFNPMLDDRFLGIVERVRPGDKRYVRFLSRLQLALDPELAQVPLDNRPAPGAYAHMSPANALRLSGSAAGKFARKVRQRLHHANKPPAGGELMAAKTMQYWRAHPESLERLHGLGVFHEPWLAAVFGDGPVPTTSTVAFMINVLTALDAAQPN